MGKQIDHNSFWVIKQNPITKIGVFPYLGRQISPELEPNKIYQVLRPESELFAAEALASFNELPITIGHALLGPREEGFTPAEEKGIDGTTGTAAERKGDKIVNDIKLFSERIKDEVNHGKKELSAGYFCDFVPERGTWNGRHYDFVQKNIRGNHIALVDKGRSGHDVRVMDSAEGVATRQFVCDAMDLTGKFEEKGTEEMKQKVTDAQWEEGKHKRDSDGKFSSTGGGSNSAKNPAKSKPSRHFSEKQFYIDANISYVKKLIAKEEKFLKRALEQNKPELAKEKKGRIKKLKEAIKGLKSSRYGYGWDVDLSSKNHGNSGLDAATGKEMTMEQLKKAIEEIKALFANPEEGDKDAKLAEIISGLKDEPAADDKCATDEDVDKRKLIDEIGGILNGKVDEELLRTVIKKAEEIAYNDSTATTADDEEETEEDEEETEEKKDKKVASLDEMEKALLARLSRKAEMVKQLTPIIGAFDSADMTEKEVAAYACKKLNLSAAMDEAPAVVKGYLAGRAKNDVRVTFGAKAKTSAQDEILNNFKEGK
jgi:antitoxin component HigA of HigAB toxin-antitoxin module